MFHVRPRRNEAEADRFDLLALVFADYEAKNRPIEASDVTDLLRAAMEHKGLKQRDSK